LPRKDMPLEELKRYTGSTPVPDDFWNFWDKMTKKAWSVPFSYEIIPSDLPQTSETEFFDVWLEGVNGEKLHAKYIRPKSMEKVPVVLQFHGYPGASRGWFEQASFVGMGMAVLAMDCPGQGGSSEDLGGRAGTTASDHIIQGVDGDAEKMYYVEVFMDTCLMVRLAMNLPELDCERIYVNGASQGAGLGLVCTALNSSYIRRCAALYPFLSDYRRAWDMDRDVIVYNGLNYYTRWFDPEGKHLTEFFTKLGYIDVQNFVERITCPVLFGTGLMDEICPPSSQFAVFSKIRAPKQHLIFPEFGHEEIAAFDDKLIAFFGEEAVVCQE